MLFNEPKLLKSTARRATTRSSTGFSALQRAEIAEICSITAVARVIRCFSALQRAEIAEMYIEDYVARLRFAVSVLFNEPKLLKYVQVFWNDFEIVAVSVLFNEPKLLKSLQPRCWTTGHTTVSVLFNEPKLLKFKREKKSAPHRCVSVLFNEPKLLKFGLRRSRRRANRGFSALQRAEIAEIPRVLSVGHRVSRFSALQRAEIAEILRRALGVDVVYGFSALQRAEIAEIEGARCAGGGDVDVSVLFNEPKLLKSDEAAQFFRDFRGFSALQRAEIAEIAHTRRGDATASRFQCSSTSRNC